MEMWQKVENDFCFKGSYVTNRAIFHIPTSVYIYGKETVPIEPRCEKTAHWDFRPGPTQTGLAVTEDG